MKPSGNVHLPLFINDGSKSVNNEFYQEKGLK